MYKHAGTYAFPLLQVQMAIMIMVIMMMLMGFYIKTATKYNPINKVN